MGSGPYGLETVKDKFKGCNDSVVRVIYDAWEKPGSTNKTQIRTDYMPIEDAVKEYGDCVYSGWYTDGWTKDGRWKASMWISADKKHLYMR